MKKINRPTTKMSLLALAISMNTAMGAYAAESLETIVVTAGKIEQDVQQTALSIQSISDEKLSAAGIESLQDVAKFTPGLQLEQTGGGLTATVRIRGIGTPGFSALDPSVPIFIDGVAQGRTGAGFQDLLDVARVEVLRGPQGTLYGRNSTAGAINVWTKDASTRSWEGSAQVQVGNLNDREFKGTINVPMVENVLGGRFSIFSVDRDGETDKVMIGDTGGPGYADRVGGRSKITLTPLDDVSITWITDYSKNISHPQSQVLEYPARFDTYAAGGIASNPRISNAELQSNGLPKPDPYSRKAYGSYGSVEDKNIATSLNVNWDITEGLLADHSLTSISAYQDFKNIQDTDRDGTVLEWQRSIGESQTRSFSQEFRISSDASEKWEYVGGLFYYGEIIDSNQDTNTLYTDALAALARGVFGAGTAGRISNSTSHTSATQDNAAIFGQATYAFTDEFSVTAGLRGSWVKKNQTSTVDTLTRFANGGSNRSSRYLVPHATSQIERDLSGVLKARYFLDEGVMLYASFDRGFKPGGFNRLVGGSGGPISYTKENSNNFEIGAKTQWFDNRLQANIAAFYMDFMDYHNQVNDPATSNIIVENIKSVTSEGIEIDLQALLGSGFTTGLSLTYLNPRVNDNKISAKQSTTRPGQSQNLNNGQLINDVSQYSANFFGEYTYPIGAAEGFVRTDVSYRSKFLLAKNGLEGSAAYREIEQGGYSLVNLRAGVRKLDEHWQLTGWVKNVTDKEYALDGGVGIGGQTDGKSISPGLPRTYGVTVQYDY